MRISIEPVRPTVIVYEPEHELRQVYHRHLEARSIPVLSVGGEEELLAAVSFHRPHVVLFSVQSATDRLWQTLLTLSKLHSGAHIVLLSGEDLDSRDVLGTNIAALIHKQQSSPKEVIYTISKFLNQELSRFKL